MKKFLFYKIFNFNKKITLSTYLIMKDFICDTIDNLILHNMFDDIFNDLSPEGNKISFIFER
jgi:hypothetical protein